MLVFGVDVCSNSNGTEKHKGESETNVHGHSGVPRPGTVAAWAGPCGSGQVGGADGLTCVCTRLMESGSFRPDGPGHRHAGGGGVVPSASPGARAEEDVQNPDVREDAPSSF